MILPRSEARHAPIEVRSPKGGGGGGGRGGGGGSSSGTKSGSTVVVGGGGNGTPLPLWQIILIVVLTIWLVVFLCALAVYYKKAEKKGGNIKHGKVWWKAFAVSTFLWIPILIYKKIAAKKRHTSKGLISGGETAGAYAKIEGGAAHNLAPENSSSAPYGEGGTGYRPHPYESYSSTTIAPSPMGSPNLGPAKVEHPPPPYAYHPGNQGGEGQEYYSGHPLNNTTGGGAGQGQGH